MRLLSLPWLLAAGGARALTEPDRIRLRWAGGLRDPQDPLPGRIDEAVARDDLAQAEGLLAEMPAQDPRTPSLEAAVLLLAGEVTLAEQAARGATTGRARARRVIRRARSWRKELGSTPPGGRAAPGERTPVRAPRDDQPLRVLHVVKTSLPHVQAGYTLRTQAIVSAQLTQGIDAQVVTRLGFPVAQGALAARCEVVDDVRYHRLLSARGADVDRYGSRLADLAQRLNVDVLHAATDHVNGHAALIAARRLGLPFVYEVRGFLEDSWASRHGGDARAASTERYRAARERETEVMLAADAVITLSEMMADDLVSRGVARDRVWLVPNGVAEDYLDPVRDARRMKRLMGLEPERLWVGSVTSIHHLEGLPTLVEAVRLARAGGLDVGAVIVGDGPARAEVLRLLPDDGTVRCIGRVAPGQALDWYDALDAVVVPRIDSRVTRLVTPLKPVEALARARLVIASDLPALREATGGHARFVEPDDAAALAIELAMVDDHRDLGTAGRAWVERERRWRHVCTTYSAAYAATARL